MNVGFLSVRPMIMSEYYQRGDVIGNAMGTLSTSSR